MRIKLKKKLNEYSPNINMETIFMNTKNNKKMKKTNEPHKFILNLS